LTLPATGAENDLRPIALRRMFIASAYLTPISETYQSRWGKGPRQDLTGKENSDE